MKERIRFSKHVNLQKILSGLLLLFLFSIQLPGNPLLHNYVYWERGKNIDNQGKTLKDISLEIARLRYKNDITGLLSLADSLILSVNSNNPYNSFSADIYYYAGVCEFLAVKNENAAKWLRQSVIIKEKLAIRDTNLAKSLYNLGVVYSSLGDPDNVIKYTREYIDCAVFLFGENSTYTAEGYSILIGVSFENKNFEDFVNYSFKALSIISKNPKALDETKLRDLYSIIGSGYAAMGDYAKGKIYLEEAANISDKNRLTKDNSYINLINSLAITYGNLGMTDKENEYFNKGVELAKYDESLSSFNMINTYAISLAQEGKIDKGESLLKGVLEKAKSLYGTDSHFYAEMLIDFASYQLDNSKDPHEALKNYSRCIDFLNRHRGNKNLNNIAFPRYAEALFKCGDYENALKNIQKLLFNSEDISHVTDSYGNPPVDSLKSDKTSLNLLRLKHKILWSIYTRSSDQNILEYTAKTSELMISLLDKMRSDISEEDSRLILGNRFREAYVNAIHDFALCYHNTGNPVFLEKAFEFAEKSKVAGLLAATRELNALQFNIPVTIADLEKSLQNKIGYYNSKISMEYDNGTPDIKQVSEYQGKLLTAIKTRDSLLLTFKKDYPGYYTLKYNTNVPTLKDIPAIIGRNNNYLNYVVSDSVLYIFLVNRKNIRMHSFSIDSAFFSKLHKFRTLLSDQAVSVNARVKFNKYKKEGYDLYKLLIEPVRSSFISDNLIIAPDNILSYLPFETLITAEDNGNDMYYRDLSYLMKDYNISYTYSATFMKELVKRENKALKDVVAFAPVYTRSINTDSIFIGRQSSSGILYDLPEARQEAEYVSRITRGKAYMFGHAKESVFKKVAGDYRIIHLAMHTYLNDQSPMNSAMIFSQDNDLPEDGLLYTYEVYGIPMNARMVVLSSCNTGNGILSSGEGILSLARGFLYSGCQSVVMSMWEVDDKSGTDVMKMFYENLLKGQSKAQALKSARTSYLKKASQLRSHPYFWSSLVIYGENDPVYPKHTVLIILGILLGISSITLLGYLLKRRYS
jgi:CHAT domain-containing protein/Tfp pilus assembly protein PilF